GLTDLVGDHLAYELAAVGDLLAAHRGDDVTWLDVRLLRGPAVGHRVDEDARARVRELEGARELGREILDPDADPRALDHPLHHDRHGDSAREGRGDGEADVRASADDHRVDPEHVTAQVAEGAAGVARVDARVRLEVVLDGVHPEAAATLRAEHPG